MKKIVCEMCESTDFIKEDGLFVCQGCGCKYSMEEAKKMMKEVGDDEARQNTGYSNEEPEDEGEEIPIHTSDSPNKLSVRVIKVGHETYTTASVSSLSVLLGGEPAPVFADGPDQVGHIGAQISLENVAGKTIKYVTVYLAPYNAVGDQVGCTVQGHSVYGIEITGPMTVGQKWEGYSDGMWYNNSIVNAKIDHVHCIYMDGTEEIYEGKEFYSASSVKVNAEPGEKIATLTVKRNQTALTTKTNKLNRVVCTLSNGEQFELGLGQTVTLPVKHGTYTISFEFWGQSMVPAKCKSTPEFVVDGDVYVELTPDAMWGGFKSKIIK